jgi:MFS family permease
VPRLVKRQVRMLEPEAWREAKRTASRIGVSPTALLATAFAEAVRPWSATPGFTLGLVGSYKPPIHPQIDHVLGNFNTVQLLAVEASAGNFDERARRLQQRIATDLDHQAFSGHRVLREWNRRQRTGGRASLPVLFDSVIEYGHAAYQDPEPRQEPGENVKDVEDADASRPRWRLDLTEVDLMISLPQVLVLAIAIEEEDGSLSFVSQAVEEVLVPGCIPDLLDRLRNLLAHLGGGEAVWHEEPAGRPGTGLEEPPPPAPLPASPAIPWGPLEHELADLWEEILGHRPAPGGSEDFFALGGDSLTATRLLSRVQARWGHGFAAADFFARPTLEAVAESLRRTTPRPAPLRRLAARARAALPWLRQEDGAPRHGASHGMRMYFILWTGLLVSGFGTALGSFTLGVWLFQHTKSATQFSMLMFVAAVTGLVVSPFAGAMADRFDRRRLLIAVEVASTLMVMTLALLLYTGHLQTWFIYPFVLTMVALGTFQQPALFSSISLLVPRDQLVRASGMAQTAGAVTGIVAPLLAGVLIATISFHGVILIDCCTFLFSILAMLVVRIPRAPATAEPERRTFRRDLLEGLNYLRMRHGLLYLLLLFGMTNFSMGIVQATLTPLILSFATAAELGTINSISAAGGLLGGIAISVWGGPRHRLRMIAAGLAFQGLILLLGGLRPSVPLIAAATFCFMAAMPLILGSNQAIWQAKVDHAVQGRVFALRGMIGTASVPIAYLLAGPLADQVFEPLLAPGGALAGSVGRLIGVGPGRGVGLMYMILGLSVVLIVCLFYFLNPRLRRLEAELPDAAPLAEPG